MPPLDSVQIDWLNKIASTHIELPAKDKQSGSGGEKSKKPTPSDLKDKPNDEILKLIQKELQEQLLDKTAEEEFADEQRKSLLIGDALRRIEPLKKTMKASNDLVMRNQKEQFEFLAANTELVGETREIRNDTIIQQKDGPKVDFNPKKDGDLIKQGQDLVNEGELLKKKAQALTEAEKKRKAEIEKKLKETEDLRNQAEQRKQDYVDLLAQINKDAAVALQLVTALRKDLENRTTTRSMIDFDKSIAKYKETAKVEAVFFDSPAQPLFSVMDLQNEIYTPLVNERVLAESFVIDKFSATQKMIDATNALYKKELVNATDPETGLAEFAQSMIDMGSELASGILKQVGVDTSMVKTLVQGCTELAKLVVTAADKLPDGLDADTTTSLVTGVAGVLGSMIAGVVPGGKEIGNAISTYSGTAVGGISLMVQSIKSGEAPKADKLVDFFSGALTAGLSNAPEKGGVDYGALLDTLQKATAGAVKDKLDDFITAVKIGDPRKLRGALSGMCISLVASIPDNLQDTYDAVQPDGDQSDLVGEVGDAAKELVEAEKSYREAMEKIEKDFPEGEGGDEKKKEKSDAKKKALLEKLEKTSAARFDALEKQLAPAAREKAKGKQDYDDVAASIKAEFDEEREQLKKALSGGDDPAKANKTIANLMKKMQRDKAIISVAIAIGKGGLSIASQFVAPISIGVEAVKMAENIAAAVQRAVDLRKFAETEAGAKAGTSVYLTSIQNFIDNQENQLDHYSLEAAMNGVKIIASAVATAFPMAAPAVLAVSAVQAGAAAKYALDNRQAIVKAWGITKKALEDPKNRRLALQARRLNPTLAKYCIAYGATEVKDPVAVRMAGDCGLDNDTLADKNSKADAVKQYLEARFDDDNKVTGAFKESDGWVKKLPELDLKSATVFQVYRVMYEGLGELAKYKEVFGNEEIVPPKDLIGYLRTLEKQKLADDATDEAIEERLLLIGNLQNGFRVEGKRLLQVDGSLQDVLNDLADLAGEEQEKVTMKMLTNKVEAAKQKKQGS
jgi:hypothetical protein